MNGWMSVKDRLPVLNESIPGSEIYVSDLVLIFHNRSYGLGSAPAIWIAYLYKHKNDDLKWIFLGDLRIGEVKYWMPLPKEPT